MVTEAELIDNKETGGRYGPAMLAISFRQKMFVEALLDNGGRNAKLAARLAGYAGESEGSLEVQAHRLMHNDLVLDAIREESIKRMRSFGMAMVTDLVEIAGNHENAVKDRLKAIGMVLDRTGMQAIMEHKVTVDDRRSRADLLKELIEGLKSLGSDAGPLMIDVTPEIEEEPVDDE